MADEPQAKPECEHYWAFHCYGGLSVRLCKLCHEPDWDDVREQQEQARRKALAAFAAEVDDLIADFTPGSHGGLKQYLAERAAFPAVREALKAVAGRARDIAEGAP